MAYLLSVVVWLAFQAVPGKNIAPFFGGTQFAVRIHLGVVDQASISFLTFLFSAGFCVVSRLSVLVFVRDPRY